jgi:endogenous inhibitor of DNA gyrase (YacG/DUF329 family)
MTEERLGESSLERKPSRIVTCPCGKQVRHRTGRRPRFCSTRCRNRENGRGRVRKASVAPGTRASAKLEKKNNKFNALQRAKTLSSHRIFGPPDLLAVEVWDGRSWEPAISSDGTRIEIGHLRTRVLVS